MSAYYTARGKLDEEALNEIKRYLFSPGFERLIWVFMGFFGVMALLFWVLRSGLLAGIFSIAVVLIYAERLIGQRYCVRKVVSTIEKSGQDKLEYDMNFYDNHFTVEGEDDKRLEINYLHVTRLLETRQYYTLFTKGNMCFPVLKDSIPGEKREWQKFVLEQNKKIAVQIAKNVRCADG